MLHSELLAQIVPSFSICQIVLHLLPLNPIWPTWKSLILSSSCWVSLMSPPDASACRTATCSSAPVPGFISTSPAPRSTRALFLSLTRSVSAVQSLYAFILAFPVTVLSMIDRSVSLSAFIFMCLCRFSMQCKRCGSWAASSVSVSFNVRRQDVKSSGFSFWCSFNPWQWRSRSFFVSCDFLRQIQFWSHALSRLVPTQARSFLKCSSINFRLFVSDSIVCISGSIRFLLQTSCACSKKLSKTI